MSEDVVYTDHNVRVSVADVEFDGRRYSLADVISVTMCVEYPEGFMPLRWYQRPLVLALFVSFLALLLLITAMIWPWWNLARNLVGEPLWAWVLVCISAALLWTQVRQRRSKPVEPMPTYVLVLRTSAGPIDALKSHSRTYIGNIAEAVSKAKKESQPA